MSRSPPVSTVTGVGEIDPEAIEHRYVQLANILRTLIADGSLAPGRPIPSKKHLRETYGVSGETVDKAIAILRGEGLVVTVHGRGIFVSQLPG